MTTLIVCNGKHRGREFVLPDMEIVVGRDQTCDIRLSSRRVSRRHCTLQPTDEGLVLRELGSSNGTDVNGQPVVGTRILKPGDTLRVGSWEFRVAGAQRSVAVGGRQDGIEDEIADWLGDADDSTAGSASGGDTTMMIPARPAEPPREFASVAEEAADIIRRHKESLGEEKG